jgi:hypothetical protein
MSQLHSTPSVAHYVLLAIQSVTARFVFFRIFRTSHHRHSNTLLGWSTWASIIAASWVAAFIIAEVIPFFSDMLSVMSSLFGMHGSFDPIFSDVYQILCTDCWFGFIFWVSGGDW